MAARARETGLSPPSSICCTTAMRLLTGGEAACACTCTCVCACAGAGAAAACAGCLALPPELESRCRGLLPPLAAPRWCGAALASAALPRAGSGASCCALAPALLLPPAPLADRRLVGLLVLLRSPGLLLFLLRSPALLLLPPGALAVAVPEDRPLSRASLSAAVSTSSRLPRLGLLPPAAGEGDAAWLCGSACCLWPCCGPSGPPAESADSWRWSRCCEGLCCLWGRCWGCAWAGSGLSTFRTVCLMECGSGCSAPQPRQPGTLQPGLLQGAGPGSDAGCRPTCLK